MNLGNKTSITDSVIIMGLGLSLVSIAGCPSTDRVPGDTENTETTGDGDGDGDSGDGDGDSGDGDGDSGDGDGDSGDGDGDGDSGDGDGDSGDGDGDSGDGDGDPSDVCGDGAITGAEACDDANADESDGCLSDCTVPRTCAEILASVPDAGDGEYTINPDGMPMQAYCDMQTDGGGWTLVAKINDADVDDLAEPVGWFDMELAADTLNSPDFVLNEGLASHGASRFVDVLTPEAVARFDLFAADDFDTRAKWFKSIASGASLTGGFGADAEPSQVCTNEGMTQNCGDGLLFSDAGYVGLGHMDLVQYGYDDACGDVAMRLDDNDISEPSAVASCTNDPDWPTSYFQMWGNPLQIWLRETAPESMCGDGVVDDGEACDDANGDEADGCLSNCVIPGTCGAIHAAAPGEADGTYLVDPDGEGQNDPFSVYCDMSTDGGGWTLVATVNPANQDDLPEPPAWFDQTLAPDLLETPELVFNQGLASLGASRFAGAISNDSSARFEVFATDDLNESATWFKAVASAQSFGGWFAGDDEPSQVCRDVDMTLDCADGLLASDAGYVDFGNMKLGQYGYTAAQSCDTLAMRLDDNNIAAPSGVASCTTDQSWPNSYLQMWGNALHIWLR